MGGAAQTPMAGKMMNEEFMSKFAQQRQTRNEARQQQFDEKLLTLQRSGQKPYQGYLSPYEPNKDLFDFGSLYKDNTFG